MYVVQINLDVETLEYKCVPGGLALLLALENSRFENRLNVYPEAGTTFFSANSLRIHISDLKDHKPENVYPERLALLGAQDFKIA